MGRVSANVHVLSEDDLAHTESMFGDPIPGNTHSFVAIRYVIEGDEQFGYLSLFRVGSTEGLGAYWCDVLMFHVGSTDKDGSLLFNSSPDIKPFVELNRKEDAVLDGYAKWDGCRELSVDEHVCSDKSLFELMTASSLTMMQASRLAGYEGDGA